MTVQVDRQIMTDQIMLYINMCCTTNSISYLVKKTLQCLSECARIIFPVHRTFTNSNSKLCFFKTMTADCTHFCFLFVCTTWLLTKLASKGVVSLLLTMDAETFSDIVISFKFVYIRTNDNICSLLG